MCTPLIYFLLFQGECFYQKHLKGKDPYISVHSVNELLELVQIGAFEYHAWGCRETDIEHPDQIVMDFDPGPEVSFLEVKKAALELKRTLDRLDLVSFLKVTGGKGLHVHIPISPIYSWDEIRAFTKVLSQDLEFRFPNRFVSQQSKALRTGKIFVDYLRNTRGATAVAPYSLRVKAISAVAMPIDWKDLPVLRASDSFTLSKSIQHLKKRKRDPWAGIQELMQEISILKRGGNPDLSLR